MFLFSSTRETGLGSSPALRFVFAGASFRSSFLLLPSPSPPMGAVVSRLQGRGKVQKPASVTADDDLDDLSTDTTSSWDEVDEEGFVPLQLSPPRCAAWPALICSALPARHPMVFNAAVVVLAHAH